MNAHEVIDAYVRDVARCLPRSRREDVALELRSLLADELAAKTRAVGATADPGTVMALLRSFGRPAEVAARYHQRPALIEPAYSHHFMIWSMAGAITASVLAALDPTKAIDRGEFFLKWLGMLVVAFALFGWWRRHNPTALPWKPRHGPERMPRWTAGLAFAATLALPVFMYVAPMTFTHTVSFGRLPVAGLELTEAFRTGWLRATTLALFALLALMYATILVQGQRRAWIGWMSAALHGALGLLMVAHTHPAAGPAARVFASAEADAVAAPIFRAVGALLILGALYDVYREWMRITPAPR
jgi:hypothetical protein